MAVKGKKSVNQADANGGGHASMTSHPPRLTPRTLSLAKSKVGVKATEAEKRVRAKRRTLYKPMLYRERLLERKRLEIDGGLNS